MLTIVIASQALLYISFSVILGTLILAIVPPAYRPEVQVPKKLLAALVVAIALFSFIPILQVILYIYDGNSLGAVFRSVLTTFEIGKAWLLTLLLAAFLFLFIVSFDYRKKPALAWIGIVLTILLIIAMGWSSHASSYDPVMGFFNHATHVSVVSVWAGTLLIASWFSKNHKNWPKFLSWFTPVAVVCFLGTIVTGIVLMSFSVEVKDYVNGWILPYGQALLLKHLLIVPLLVYAFINSLLIRKKVTREPQWDPRPWAKVEGIIILLIFSATAVLGQQSLPYEATVKENSASTLFLFFYQGNFQPGMTVEWIPTAMSLAFFLLAILFILLMLTAYLRKFPPASSFIMGIIAVICGYLGLMGSIQ